MRAKVQEWKEKITPSGAEMRAQLSMVEHFNEFGVVVSQGVFARKKFYA